MQLRYGVSGMTAENHNIISAAIIVILATAVVDAMPGAAQSVGLFNFNYANNIILCL